MNFDYVEDFWIQKLVFINSGGSANVVLPMSVMGLLLGRNNVGKTSGISALKLFLLPETTFKDCKNKFGFASNGGYHDGPESWNFYFPSERSFIICEAENTRGTFCMILHRSSSEEFGYSRIVVPVKFDQIQHLFWDYDQQFNSGFGRNLDHLSLQTVREGLKPFKPEYLTKTDEIKEAIYSRPGYVDDLSRYCLLPLPQKGDRREVEAIRSLLNLAFRISGVDKLAGAVASIIETENAGREGRLSVDVLSINREYEQLKQEAELLRKIKIHESIWKQLKDSYSTYIIERTELVNITKEILAAEELLKAEIEQDKQQFSSSFQEASQKHDKHEKFERNVGGQVIAAKRVLKEKQTDLKRCNQQIQLADEYWNNYSPIDGNNTKHDVAKYLEAELVKIEEDIIACQNAEHSKAQLDSLQQKRIQLSLQIKETEKQIAEDKISTLELLDQRSKSLLHSLNKGFDHITASVTHDQKHTIESFGTLFEIDQGQLYFLDQKMTGTPYEIFDPEKARRELKRRLEHFQNEHSDLLERMNIINESQKTNDITGLLKDRDDFKNVIKYLDSYDLIKDQHHELTIQIEALTIEIESFEEQHSLAYRNLSDAKAELEKIKSQKEIVDIKYNDLSRQSNHFFTARRTLNQEFKDPSFTDGIFLTHDTNLATNKFDVHVSNFQNRCATLNQTKRIIMSRINTLVNESLLPGQVPVAYDLELSFDTVRNIYENLRAIFDNYEANLDKHHADIESHNNQTGVRSAAISEIGKLIDSFRRSINSELSSVKISNLESVEIIIDVDEQFASLRDDMELVNFSGNQLLSDRIYLRLNDFCDQFFKGMQGTGKRLQLDKIITGVRYVVSKDGRSTASQQSTGTNSMINTVLLALLLKRMVPASIKLHFPIVFDEVLNLDSVNLKTIKRVVEEHNFVLFVVCPNNAGIVADVIENWYDLSLHSLSEGPILDQCKVLHFGLTERLTHDDEMLIS